MQDSMGLVKNLVVQESLKYGVLSAETAFVAVRSEPGRTVEEQVIVPNALPEGWSDSFTTAGLMKMSNRRMVNRPAGGSVLDWVGGGSMDMIMQMDGTMKPEMKRSSMFIDSSGKANLQMTFRASPIIGDTPAGNSKQSGYTLFSGTPAFAEGVAVLFDSTLPGQKNIIPETVLLKRLEMTCKIKTPVLSDSVELLIYSGDKAAPRIRIRIRDMLTHNGVRPLNIQRTNGELFRVILVDPDDEWRKDIPVLEVIVR
jgi:Ca-activated chloride channel family protein